MPQPPPPLKILILGAGIAGLSTALALSKKNEKHQKQYPTSPPRYEITILESASSLQEIGAGIQIPPNSSRYLKEWGLEEKFREKVCWPDALVVGKWDDGMEMGRLVLRDGEEKYGSPYWYIHRADYQKILYDAAISSGISILLNHSVKSITTSNSKPIVHLLDGNTVEADLIIGADGIHSQTRNFVLPKAIKPIESPSTAYRLTIPSQKMLSTPLTTNLMSSPNANIWMHQESNIIGYPIRSGTVYNLVLIRPGPAPLGVWNEPGDIHELREYYSGWDEVVRCLLMHVESCVRWKLGYLPRLERWVNEEGNVVILGDAAHAMLPNLAQGAATGLEDGVALAECLERVAIAEDIPGCLRAFEKVRKGRCEVISRVSREVGERGGRGEREDAENDQEERVTNDDAFRDWLYGYDTVKETNKFLDEMFANEERKQGMVEAKVFEAD